MAKLTKNQKIALSKIEAGKAYSVTEGAAKVKDVNYAKFDASVDIDVRLGVDPRKANQMVRGVVTLPHGTGKVVRVLVLCNPDQEEAAKAAGADYVGLDEYINKIKGGWTDVDVIITQPQIMGKIGALVRKDGLPDKAREIVNDLKFDFATHYDEKDSIGKRYRRQDAIGTPFCITVDHQTLEDNTVTLRERDSMEQTRVSVDDLHKLIHGRVSLNSLLRKLA